MTPPIVVLWWGRALRLLDGEDRLASLDLREGEDAVAAILRLAAEARGQAGRVRIVYQPDTLDCHETACPRTTRPRLRRILAREIPALDAPDSVWGAEAIRQGAKGYRTIVYVDKASRLPELAGKLRRAGLPAEGAWPLPSLIESAAPGSDPARCYLGIARLGRLALVACAGPSGDRSLRFFEGGDCAEAVMAEARTALARFDEGAQPPGILVAGEGDEAEALAAGLARAATAHLPLAQFLARARELPRRGFSDLIAGPAFERSARRRRAAILTVAAVALAAGCFGWERREARARASQADELRRQGQAQLQQSADRRNALEREIEALTRELEEIAGAPPPHADFLEALGRAAPAAIALQSVLVEGGAFAVRGRIYGSASDDPGGPAAGDRPLAQFRRTLADSGGRWRLRDEPGDAGDPAGPPRAALGPAAPDGFFLVAGTFLPAETAPPPAPAEVSEETLAALEARAGAARDRLRSAGDPAAELAEGDGLWTVLSRQPDAAPGSAVGEGQTMHWRMACAHAPLAAWTEIVRSIKRLCLRPGVSIDSLALAVDPTGESFQQAEVRFTARTP